MKCNSKWDGVVLAIALSLWARPALAQQIRVDPDSSARITHREPRTRFVTGIGRLRDDIGAAAKTVELDSLAPKPLGTVSNVLSSRIPGVLVEQPSGATGADVRIHIRGVSNLLLPGNPLVIVDGVRAVMDGGESPAFPNALDPEEIERIDVLPGPAAGAQYGGDAADGVILITTRRSEPGRPVWRLHTQYGVLNDVANYPANFGRIDTNPSPTGFDLPCSLDRESQGLCVPGPLTSWNPLENVSPFHTGTLQRHGLSVSGGGQAITYSVSGGYDREDGVYADNEQRRTHVRGRLTGQLGHGLGLALTASYVDGMTRLPVAGRIGGGVIADGLFGAAVDDPVTRGYTDTLSSVLQRVDIPQRMHRNTLGFDAVWRPWPWLRSSGTVGFDRMRLGSSQRVVSPVVGGQAGDSVVSRSANGYEADVLTVQSALEASFGGASSLSSHTVVGVRHHKGRVWSRFDFESSAGLAVPGLFPPDSQVAFSESRSNASTTGLYAEQRFGWRDRLFLTGGIRHDLVYHAIIDPADKLPSLTDAWANLSWLISDEPFFPHASWLDELRFRTAYGQTERYLDGVIVPPGTLADMFASEVIYPPGVLPPITPKPERTREVEAGLDVALFHQRVDAELTYYDKHGTQLGEFTKFATSAGSGTEFEQDAAAIRNRGYELVLNASILRSRTVRWDLTLAGSTNKNTLTDGFIEGWYSSNQFTVPYPAMQRLQVDRPVVGYWGRRYSYDDANGDGIITRNEVQLDTALSFLGSAIPTRELSVAPSLTLFGRITLSALVDYRGGFQQSDANDALRCRSLDLDNCRAAFDATAPIADQAAVIAGKMGSEAAYIYDGTFWKLREVAVTLAAPHRWAQRFAASDLRLTLAGRNLATWTKYPGLDPELNAMSYDPIMRADFTTQVPARYLTARVDVMW